MQDTKLKVVKSVFGGGLLLLAAFGFVERSSDDFLLSRHPVPLDQIESGGAGKDGIPAILKPICVASSEVSFLR